MGFLLDRWRHGIAVLLGVVGCSSARPEYAVPKFSRIDHSELEGADMIPYRTLSIGDFRELNETAPNLSSPRSRLVAGERF
jgi:hypothetical protein